MINSGQNPTFKRWHSLLHSRGIKKHSQYLLFGRKVVEEAKNSFRSSIVESIAPGHDLSIELFRELDIFATKNEILVLSCPELPFWDGSPKSLTVLCPLGDPLNLGTLIRSARAFAVDEIVLLKEACSPFHPKSVRAASGALFRAPLRLGPSITELQPTQNSFGLDAAGAEIHDVVWPDKMSLLIGEEGPGIAALNKEAAAKIQNISIPMSDSIESLNAATAASIAMFEVSKKKGAILARRD